MGSCCKSPQCPELQLEHPGPCGTSSWQLKAHIKLIWSALEVCIVQALAEDLGPSGSLGTCKDSPEGGDAWPPKSLLATKPMGEQMLHHVSRFLWCGQWAACFLHM